MPIYSLGECKVEIRGPDVYIAPNASLIGSVIVGNECTFWFNAVVRGDNDLVTIGDRTNVQDGCVVHPDPGIPVTIGSNVSVGHMAMVHGCTIGDGSLIGIGAVILNHAVIGKNCLVGAKTLIPERKTFPDGVLILGQPGKVVRELRSEELEMLRQSAESYVKKGRRYRSEFAPRAR
ncbi:MAG TPA: gamma carbonic anhydrase family protein [Burkholderiales bacterium]|jgi:carbonic anhydrase/acetyltransferase-like protein (isoleucine patch superfamily)|nr:gamma carbonic anhydrase family protein [Burkholderiales bacterium]